MYLFRSPPPGLHRNLYITNFTNIILIYKHMKHHPMAGIV